MRRAAAFAGVLALCLLAFLAFFFALGFTASRGSGLARYVNVDAPEPLHEVWMGSRTGKAEVEDLGVSVGGRRWKARELRPASRSAAKQPTTHRRRSCGSLSSSLSYSLVYSSPSLPSLHLVCPTPETVCVSSVSNHWRAGALAAGRRAVTSGPARATVSTRRGSPKHPYFLFEQKCGTSALYFSLCKHPHIVCAALVKVRRANVGGERVRGGNAVDNVCIHAPLRRTMSVIACCRHMLLPASPQPLAIPGTILPERP